MATIALTESLREEYGQLFSTCTIQPARAAEAEGIIDRIVANRARYEEVGERLGGSPPWFVVGVLHTMESALSFTRHLHNGDPLTARTVQVPVGRPTDGEPPFTWEESALDALRLRRLDTWGDFSVAGTLYKLEQYNGWGYRLYHPHVLSPYLWAASSHYSGGKYLADGTWSDTAVSKQCGGATLLRRMAERSLADFSLAEVPVPTPMVRYAPTRYVAATASLQKWLNTLPGIFVKVDGKAGEKTSSAVRMATGHYLVGDPRAEVEMRVRRPPVTARPRRACARRRPRRAS
jgi:lysozyme family protein